MGFKKKTWKDRIADHINRRTLIKESGSEVVTVERNEGTVSQEGDAFNATNMNDLEERVSDAFWELENDLKKSVSDGKTLVANAITEKKVNTATDATFETMAQNIRKIATGSGNATVKDVLSGKTFSTSSGEYTGTMENRGAVSKSLKTGESYTVPEGYHNGKGKINVSDLGVYNTAVLEDSCGGGDSQENYSNTLSLQLAANTEYIVVITLGNGVEYGTYPGINYKISIENVTFPSGASGELLKTDERIGFICTKIYRVKTNAAGAMSCRARLYGYYDKIYRLTMFAIN